MGKNNYLALAYLNPTPSKVFRNFCTFRCWINNSIWACYLFFSNDMGLYAEFDIFQKKKNNRPRCSLIFCSLTLL